jgi:hypothetical protein
METVTIPTCPHITVYVGHESPIDESNCLGEGHLYITYGENGLPEFLARVDELDITVESGRNPEIWGPDQVLLETIGR